MNPQTIRAAAAVLSPHVNDGITMMCEAVNHVTGGADEDAARQFVAICRRCGVERMDGTLFAPGQPLTYYELEAQSVRFIFLSFLALYLESS